MTALAIQQTVWTFLIYRFDISNRWHIRAIVLMCTLKAQCRFFVYARLALRPHFIIFSPPRQPFLTPVKSSKFLFIHSVWKSYFATPPPLIHRWFSDKFLSDSSVVPLCLGYLLFPKLFGEGRGRSAIHTRRWASSANDWKYINPLQKQLKVSAHPSSKST